jgi:uncharacterized protein YlaN (UPF0358 family)
MLAVCLSIMVLTPSGKILVPNLILPEMILVENTSEMPIFSPTSVKFSVLGDLWEEDDIKLLISKLEPEMANLLIELNQCENYGDAKWRCGDNDKSCGPFQMQFETFKTHCINEGIATDWHSTIDQIICSADMIREGLGPTTQGWQNCWIKKNLKRFGY